jgi:hypothetical protein
MLSAAVMVAPACGLRHHTVATRNGTLTVAPPSGSVGTSFSLTAGGFRPGEPMTFEIDIPGRAKFVGPSHTAAPDGTVSSTYKPQTGDPPGTYQLKAVGSQGTRAQATLLIQ